MGIFVVLGMLEVNFCIVMVCWRKVCPLCCITRFWTRPPSWAKTSWIPNPLPNGGTMWLGSPCYKCLLVTLSLWTFQILTSECDLQTLSHRSSLKNYLNAVCSDPFPFSPLRYFNEMSAQRLRPRTVSSPIPYTPPSSSRPISPGEYLSSASSLTDLQHV